MSLYSVTYGFVYTGSVRLGFSRQERDQYRRDRLFHPRSVYTDSP